MAPTTPGRAQATASNGRHETMISLGGRHVWDHLPGCDGKNVSFRFSFCIFASGPRRSPTSVWTDFARFTLNGPRPVGGDASMSTAAKRPRLENKGSRQARSVTLDNGSETRASYAAGVHMLLVLSRVRPQIIGARP